MGPGGPTTWQRSSQMSIFLGKYLVHVSLSSAFVACYPEKARVHSQADILSKTQSCHFRTELQNTETEGKRGEAKVRQINDIFSSQAASCDPETWGHQADICTGMCPHV